MYFDTLYPDHVTGKINPVKVIDYDDNPNRVLELDNPWSMIVEWRLESNDPGTSPVDILDGTWHLSVSIDELGGPDEHLISHFDVPLSNHLPGAGAAKCEWQHKFNFPTGVIHKEGVYKLITLITFTDRHGRKRQMAGFSEGPVVTFYKEVVP